MADLHSQQENTKLKQQIKFLKDLIDNAKQQKPKYRANTNAAPFGAKSTWTTHPIYSPKKKSGYHGGHSGQAPHIPHFQKQKQKVDKTKYSFIRSSSAPVIIQSKITTQVFAKDIQKSEPTNPTVQPSCSSSKKELDRNLSQSKTPVRNPVDLKSHSLESLKKILADKMAAKARRKAKAAAKHSKPSGSNIIIPDTKNVQHDLFDKCTPKSYKHSCVKKVNPSSSEMPTSEIKSVPSERVVMVKKRMGNPGPRSNKKSKTAGGLPKKSATQSKTLTDAPKVKTKLNSQVSVGSFKGSSGSTQIVPVPLPSKGELAKGLKNTEAKIKELTAELTKLKEVAKIVSSSPEKQTHNTSKIRSSVSSHKLRRSSYHKGLQKKYAQSNTQHAARYVISKYKLNKEHIKFYADTKFRPSAKTYYFKKNSSVQVNPCQSKSSARHKARFSRSAYSWTKQGKVTRTWRNRHSDHYRTLLSSRWTRKPDKTMSQNVYSKYNSLAWMPFWKKQLLLRRSFGRRQTVWHKDNRCKLNSSAVHLKGNTYLAKYRGHTSSGKGLSGARTISVRGVKFQIGSTGKTLQRVDRKGNSSQDHRPQKSISRVDYRGVTYRETTPGMLEKSSSYQSRMRASQALHKSIAVSTGRNKLRKTKQKYCMFYCRFGKCNRGDNCTFIHDPDKVAVCTRFLRGTCRVENCPFSHKVSKDKMPVCSYFLKGGCVREDCPYSHVNVSKDAKVCQDFLRGFCPRGEKCKEKHILECPEFARSGKCSLGKQCKLEHRKRALKRKTPPKQSPGGQPNRGKDKEELSVGSSGSSGQISVNSDEKEEPVPFKLMKLPAFISIVSSDDEPTPSQDTPKSAPLKKPQEQLRIKPRL